MYKFEAGVRPGMQYLTKNFTHHTVKVTFSLALLYSVLASPCTRLEAKEGRGVKGAKDGDGEREGREVKDEER